MQLHRLSEPRANLDFQDSLSLHLPSFHLQWCSSMPRYYSEILGYPKVQFCEHFIAVGSLLLLCDANVTASAANLALRDFSWAERTSGKIHWRYTAGRYFAEFSTSPMLQIESWVVGGAITANISKLEKVRCHSWNGMFWNSKEFIVIVKLDLNPNKFKIKALTESRRYIYEISSILLSILY